MLEERENKNKFWKGVLIGALITAFCAMAVVGIASGIWLVARSAKVNENGISGETDGSNIIAEHEATDEEMELYEIGPLMSEEMENDMKNVIQIMNTNSSAWTRLLGNLAKELRNQNPQNCDVWISKPSEKGQLRLLRQLEEKQILQLACDGHEMCLAFKNRTLMKMFADSGAWLEYQAYLECQQSHLFDDVRISTVVDWNIDSTNKNDPTCEVDLIVIRNCIPAFVSCKMNKCSALDLYEVKLLSQKLGGTLGKAAVISKAFALRPGQPLYLKAQELGIKIIGSKEIEQDKIAETLVEFLKS